MEVIDSGKCGYMNARKLRFQNTLRESTSSRLSNTDELCMAELLSWFYINVKKKSSNNASLLITSEILGLFGKRLTADQMNSLHNRDKLEDQFQTPLFPQRKTFSELFFAFSNLNKTLHILKENSSCIAQIFWKLLTPENGVSWMPESSRFRTPIVNQHVHGYQTLTNFAWWHFYPNFTLLRRKIKLGNISPSHIWDLKTAW